MNKNIIDENLVFAINTDLKAEIITIGPNKSKVVIIDNFYKNPNLVRDLALVIPPTYKSNILNATPGGRIDAFYDLRHLSSVYYDLMTNVFLTEEERKFADPSNMQTIFDNATFCVNVTSTKPLKNRFPHIDNHHPKRYASVIYLNSTEECIGGTSFYTFQGKQEGPDTKNYKVDKNISDSDGDWEMIYLAEMKFNRMIMYQQCILHSAYLKEGMFDNNYRLAQMFFI